MKTNNDDQIIFEQYIKDEFNFKINSNFRIELVIKPQCNQSCDYCYLNKYGEQLYPIKDRISNKKIIDNINILFKFLNDNNYIIYNWELFAGDLFFDNFWFDLMDIFYNYYYNLNLSKDINILIPCNFSFCEEDNKINKVIEYVDKFKEKKINIIFSYSTDGKYQNFVREKKEISEQQYDKIFKLLEKYQWECHPMISKEGISNSIQNYDWWISQYSKYKMNYLYPDMLEVRNDGWTDQDINEYLKLLEHIIQHRFSLCNYNLENFTRHLFDDNNNLRKDNIIQNKSCMDPIMLYYFPIEQNNMLCTLGNSFTINCANLNIIPCHRLSYSFFTGGHFYLENDEVKIKVDEGISGYFAQKMANTSFNLDCHNCEIKNFCIKGCRGAQFEYSSETFMPINSVCNLFKEKNNYLIKKYHELGVLNKAFELNLFNNKQHKYYLLKLLTEKGYPEYEYKFL